MFDGKIFAPTRGTDGTFAFTSQVVDASGAITGTAGLLGKPGSLQTFAVTGDVAPDSDGLLYASFYSPVVNPNGRLAFGSLLNTDGRYALTPGEPWNNAIFFKDNTGRLVRSLRMTDILPGTTNTVLGSFTLTKFSAAGDLNIRAHAGYASGELVYVFSTAAGTGTLVAQTSGTLNIDGSDITVGTLFGGPNDDGSASFFTSFLVDNHQTSGLIYAADGVHFRSLFRTGDSAQTGDADTIHYPTIFRGIGGGHFGFATSFGPSGTTMSDGSGIYVGDVSTADYHLVARDGQQAAGRPRGTIYKTFPTFDLNCRGQIAFTAGTLDTTGSGDIGSALFVGTPGNLHSIAARRDTILDTAGRQITLNGFGIQTEFNDLGQLVFTADLTGIGVNASNDCALLACDPNHGLRVIVREGDLITLDDGSTKTFVTANNLLPIPILADDGTMTFVLNFSDGTNGIFQTVVPEPALFWTAIALLGARLRRRSSTTLA